MAQVLLVEDEGAFRELLAAFLIGEGYEVHALADGRAAAQWMREHPVDVLVTDLCMPDSDGMELLIELRKLQSSVPVVVMSGGVGGEMAGLLRAATLLGARRALAKPFGLHQLGNAIRDLLG